MKTIVLGDIHGLDIWKKIVNDHKEDCQKIIFIGDYFDSHDPFSNGRKQIDNFREILQFKFSSPQEVILLLGNHDYHYLRGVQEKYSGYQNWLSFDIQEILEQNIQYLQICHRQDNLLFSHAGITKLWCKQSGITLIDNTIDRQINLLFQKSREYFRFNGTDIYGDNRTQGPLWVRPGSLGKNKLDGFTQIVGHTRQENLRIRKDNVILIDSLPQEYLEIENGEFRILKSNELDHAIFTHDERTK